MESDFGEGRNAEGRIQKPRAECTEAMEKKVYWEEKGFACTVTEKMVKKFIERKTEIGLQGDESCQIMWRE